MIGMRGCGRDMISLNIEISSKFYKTSHRTDINHTTAGRADPTDSTGGWVPTVRQFVVLEVVGGLELSRLTG